MNKFISIVMISLAGIFLFACDITGTLSDDDAKNPSTPSDEDERNLTYNGQHASHQYKLGNLPDTSTLYDLDEYYGRKDMNGENYLLFVQGGPVLALDPGYNFFFENDEDADQVVIAEPSKWTVLQIHQYQTYEKHDGFAVSNEITMAQATQYASFSAAALFAVARHFSQQGKKIYIAGHSYGSFIIPKMIADYKYEKYVEKVIMSAGRLKMPSQIVKVFADGNSISFKASDDGLYTTPDSENIREITLELVSQFKKQDPMAFSHYDSTIYDTDQKLTNAIRSSRKLQAALGQFDYMKIYTDNQVPTDKLYILSAKKDTAVGYFDKDEITFATNHAGGYHISEEGHSVNEPEDIAYMRDVLEGKK